MKKLLPAFLLFITSLIAYSQDTTFELDKSSNVLTNADADGNYYLLFKTLKKSALDEKQMIYRFVAGKDQEVLNKVTILNNNEFFGSSVADSVVYYYYIEKDKRGMHLAAYAINKYKPGYNHIKDIYTFKAPVLTYIEDDQNYFLTFDDKTNALAVITFKEHGIVSEQVYNNPMQSLKERIKRADALYAINNKLPVTTFEAHHKNKAYIDNQRIILTFDELKNKDNQGFKFGNSTAVIELNLASGETTTYSIYDINTDPQKFNSFYYKDILYRVSVYKAGMDIAAYDIKNKTLINRHLIATKDAENKLASSPYYMRDKKNNTFYLKEFKSPRKMISEYTKGEMAISAFEAGNNIQLTVGMYFDENGTGVYAGANPIVGIATFIITTAVSKASEGPGLSNYFYSDFTKEGFEYQKPDYKSVSHTMDELELSLLTNKNKVYMRKYFKTQNKLLFLFQDMKENKITIKSLEPEYRF